LSLALVRGVVFEKHALMFKGSRNSLTGLDITLTAINNRDIAQAERDYTTSKYIDNIGSLVPNKI
jgi:hypothetical protein